MAVMGSQGPWGALSNSLKKDLEGPLFDKTRYIQDKAAFKAWWSQEFTEDAATGRLKSKLAPFLPPIDFRTLYVEWRWNNAANQGFTQSGRNAFLCVYAKLKSERLWTFVGSADWVGETGAILFHPSGGASALRSYLLAHDYGPWWFAGWGKDGKGRDYAWGLRSAEIGAGLHFRASRDPDAPINVHIDLNNPGTDRVDVEGGQSPDEAVGTSLGRGLGHKIFDDELRGATHNAKTLRGALARRGTIVPVVP
jgi:hypothetical protein